MIKGTFCSILEFGDKYHGYHKLADRIPLFETNSIAFAVRKATCGIVMSQITGLL